MKLVSTPVEGLLAAVDHAVEAGDRDRLEAAQQLTVVPRPADVPDLSLTDYLAGDVYYKISREEPDLFD